MVEDDFDILKANEVAYDRLQKIYPSLHRNQIKFVLERKLVELGRKLLDDIERNPDHYKKPLASDDTK